MNKSNDIDIIIMATILLIMLGAIIWLGVIVYRHVDQIEERGDWIAMHGQRHR